MDEDEEDFDCPSLLCDEQEDLETNNDQNLDQKKNEEDNEELFNQTNSAEEADDGEQEKNYGNNNVQNNDPGSETLSKTDEELHDDSKNEKDIINEESMNDQIEGDQSLEYKDDQKRGRKTRGKKQNERTRSKRSCKVVSKIQIQEVAPTPASPANSYSTISEPTMGLMDTCELSDPIYLGCGGTSGLYCPSVPVPLLYTSQNPVPIQPAPPQNQGTKRLHSPYLQHSVPQMNTQPVEMEITQVYSTRRSIRYSTRGRGRTLGFPLMSGLENMDNCILPPAPKKKTRTLYSTDQLEHLESLFQEDHYPDADKRKAIAASVGVTPQRIMVWFQNRRAKWRKVERSITAKNEHRPMRAGPHCSPPHTHINPGLPNIAPNNRPPAFPGHFATKLSQIAPAAPTYPTPLYNLPSSPGQPRVTQADPHQLSSQGGFAEYHQQPMHSPPPIRRASLPLFTTAPYNPANPNTPLLSALAHTPPLFLDALEAGSSLAHHDNQTLQTDNSSLFDFGDKLDYLTTSQPSNLLYQLQTTYPSSQPQHQPQRMSFLTPSPYLTPNPPDSNPTSYLTFGPGGGSAGVVTYSTGGHAFFQSQSTGQVLLQSTGHHGGITAYQSYPWGNIYTQPTMHQRPQCPPSYPTSLGPPTREHQLSSSTSIPPSLYFTRAPDQGTSNPQRQTHTQSHLPSTTSTTVLPPVSTLRPSRMRETTPTKSSSISPSQVCPTSPDSPPVPPCVKIEYDSPHEIHSHFHCDFSPIHF